MDSKIREIYHNLVQGTAFQREISQELENKINRELRTEKGQMEWKEFEQYRDKAYLIAAAAEEAGFVKGFKYAALLMAECCSDVAEATAKPLQS